MPWKMDSHDQLGIRIENTVLLVLHPIPRGIGRRVYGLMSNKWLLVRIGLLIYMDLYNCVQYTPYRQGIRCHDRILPFSLVYIVHKHFLRSLEGMYRWVGGCQQNKLLGLSMDFLEPHKD